MVLFDNDDQYFRYKKIMAEYYKLISINNNRFKLLYHVTKRKFQPNYYGPLKICQNIL